VITLSSARGRNPRFAYSVPAPESKPDPIPEPEVTTGSGATAVATAVARAAAAARAVADAPADAPAAALPTELAGRISRINALAAGGRLDDAYALATELRENLTDAAGTDDPRTVEALALEAYEAELLRYKKVTADGRDLQVDPRDLYDMLELDKRTDRILPNGWCLLPPRQACDKGNACLTCEKFTTDATFLPELKTQQQRTGQLIGERRQTFKARTGQEMGPDNVWLAGRLQEQDALGRIIVNIEQTRLADGTVQAIRGAGVAARTDAITRDREARS
jgi:hypothetical protein